MKKNIIILILITVVFVPTKAQNNNSLIYNESDEDFITYYLGDSRHLDINNDSIPDFYFDTFLSGYYWGYGIWPENDWECCSYSLEEYPGVNNIFRDLNISLNDSSLVWNEYQFSSELYPYIHCDTASYKIALRRKNGDDYFYGWVEVYSIYNLNSYYKLKVSRTCFCAIPNYPLRWGQTSLEGFVDNEATGFAIVYPNPINSQFTVTGKNLKSAEVINTLGQRVATVQGKGETLQIDIATQPSGIYFVRITDEQGRKCVRKVVKE